MKKSLLFVLLLIVSAVFISCDNKKSNGGTPPPANTPLAQDNLASYLGNYTVTSVSIAENGNTVNTANIKEVLDYAGIMVVTADGANAAIKGSIQLGGNSYITADINKAPFFEVTDFAATLPVGGVTVVDTQNIKFQSLDGAKTYDIAMKKNNDLTSVNTKSTLWKDTGLCYETKDAEGNYFNCNVTDLKDHANTKDDITVIRNGNNTDTMPKYDKADPRQYAMNSGTNAMQLIGNYYIQSITIINSGTTGCTAGATITNVDNALIGELSAKAGLGGTNAEGKLIVELDLALKFQFSPAISGCSFEGYQYNILSDKIPVEMDITNIDFGQIFSDEGLIINGTETITYEPKKRNASGVLEDAIIGGAQIKITLKKSRDGVLGKGYAKTLDNASYYE